MGTVKKLLGILLALAALAGILSGCGMKEEAPPSLWVVTEATDWDGMNSQANQAIELFEADHPGFTVRLDILPEEKVARQQYFDRLRTEIMSGHGPDVYLLPTDTNTLSFRTFDPGDNYRKVPLKNEFVILMGQYYDLWPTELQISTVRPPLFEDVEQVMRNGLFTDIGPYYDADETLGRNAMNQAVMDAGTYRGKRYILPLRYDIPTLYVDLEGLKKYGLTMEDIDGGISELLDTAIAVGDHDLACGADPYFLNLGQGFSVLSQPLDYENGRVNITQEEIAALLHRIQDLEALVQGIGDHRVRMTPDLLTFPERPIFENGTLGGRTIGYYMRKTFPLVHPIHVAPLAEIPLGKMFSLMEDSEYAVIPLRGIHQDVTAYVTYFGAVGAGCDHPKEAYEFLRLFLSEDFQFERNRPFNTAVWMDSTRNSDVLIEAGWPVRVKNSANDIWGITRRANQVVREMRGLDVTEEDFPMLGVQIDHVTFGALPEQEFARMIRSLNDTETGEPTDADIEAMAEQFYQQLRWHVMEG